MDGRGLRIDKGRVLPAMLLVIGFTAPVCAQALQNPRRIAAGPEDLVLVTDRRHGAIVALDRTSLETAWSFALPNEGAPFGIATGNRQIYVGNTKTMNVEVYRMPHGSRLEALQNSHRTDPAEESRAPSKLKFEYNLGHTTGLVGNPIDIAVDSKSRQVFVLDGAEKQVLIFDKRGALVHSFHPVDQAGQLLSPVSLSVDSKRGEVLVGDYGDPSGSFRASTPARILIYTFAGELLFQIDGDGGTDPSTKFVRVQGMAVSPEGHILATDPLGGWVLVLDRDSGATLGQIGTPGDQPGDLMLPLDVWVDDKSGDVFVSNNRGARRLEVFRGAGSGH